MDVPSVSELGESFDKPARHLFVSLGTLSNQPGAIIASVAFIVADPRSEKPIDTHYFKTVDWEQQDRRYSFSVIQSMLGRSAMARKSVVNHTPPVQAPDALRAMAQAWKSFDCVAIWGNAQDLAILKDAMNQFKIDVPWDRTQERDIVSVWATLGDLGIAPEMERDVTEPAYVALGDAAFMCRGVATVYRGFRTKNPPADRVLGKDEGADDHVVSGLPS